MFAVSINCAGSPVQRQAFRSTQVDIIHSHSHLVLDRFIQVIFGRLSLRWGRIQRYVTIVPGNILNSVDVSFGLSNQDSNCFILISRSKTYQTFNTDYVDHIYPIRLSIIAYHELNGRKFIAKSNLIKNISFQEAMNL